MGSECKTAFIYKYAAWQNPTVCFAAYLFFIFVFYLKTTILS